jgi:hypothetical protein
MRMHTRLLVAGLAFLTATCSPESITPVDEGRPTQHLTGPFVVSGTITGPGGVSICSLVSGLVRVRLYLPTGSLAGSQNICQGSNSYMLSVPGATYYLQVALPVSSTIGSKVLRSLDPVPLDVTADMVRDFQVENGLPFGGGMTLDGLPVNGGGSLLIYHGELQGILSTSALTLPSGAWYEPSVRPAVYLQNGASYRFVPDCQMLAADMLTPPPAGPLVFPTQVSSISCDFTSNTAGSRTHFNNRLVVTADAGDFGAQAPAQVAQRGRGWGVQFPVGAGGPVHFPMSAKQLYQGGLLFGFASGKELSTTDMSGYGACSPACADFDVTAPPTIGQSSAGKVVSWRYSDAASPETEGLQVTQWSYDGNGDYVLFNFVIKNTTMQLKTFWAGAFMDWDLGSTSFDDWIMTDWGGSLMVTTDPAGGSHFGTLLLGQFPSGNYAYGSSPTCGGEATSSQRVAALMGTLSVPHLTLNNCDKRYVHGAGPITLAPGHQTSLGVALVAGDDLAGFRAAATAAAGEFHRVLGHVGGPSVTIDIRPGSTSNPVNTRASGLIPVAILGGYSIYVPDVTQVDITTLVFGPGGASEPHNLSDPKVLADHLLDVNGDGMTDLVGHFGIQESGLVTGATQGCINGVTTNGLVFDACDVVNVK